MYNQFNVEKKIREDDMIYKFPIYIPKYVNFLYHLLPCHNASKVNY